METNRPVVVKRMPERVRNREARTFLQEVEPLLKADRPQVVFDCSQVEQIDASGVELLLQCLRLVMRRDGDLKLAAVSPQMALLLEMTRTDRLFEMYDSSSDAALSFSRFIPAAMRNFRDSLTGQGSMPAVQPDTPPAGTAAA